MVTVRVETEAAYDVLVGEGLLSEAGERIRSLLPGAEMLCVVSDETVDALYGERLAESLAREGFAVFRHVIAPGEKSKDSAHYLELLNTLAEHRLTKSDAVIALGGGVCGDLAGFAAATYLRGIPYVQIPTSLLAMVDSSVGGKTAVNLPQGKNLAGAFYQPKLVLCDLSVLDTLPEAFWTDGCAEVMKYGVLEGGELFDHLEERGVDFDRAYVIPACIGIKAEYVRQDEFDTGLRQKLNLGHTVGHGIEAVSEYEVSHGRAVAAGLSIIAGAAVRAGFLRGEAAERIRKLLAKCGLPTETTYSLEELLLFLLRDKKRRGDSIRLIVPHDIGHCELHSIPVGELREFLAW
ncbi:MAG: 3-dehydroquinate synthase [Lachnospiraceae bacterium]|nr:3-dehydroquinate synthase [Lachnospiraceae bacterium]